MEQESSSFIHLSSYLAPDCTAYRTKFPCYGVQAQRKPQISTSRLRPYFIELGISDAYDMTGIILASYRDVLSGKPIDFRRRIVYYWLKVLPCPPDAPRFPSESPPLPPWPIEKTFEVITTTEFAV
jgi:hypothetical protein